MAWGRRMSELPARSWVSSCLPPNTWAVQGAHSLRRTPGWESKPVPTHRETGPREDAELASDLLPLPPSPNLKRLGRTLKLSQDPTCCPLKEPWTRPCFSCPILVNRDTGT